MFKKRFCIALLISCFAQLAIAQKALLPDCIYQKLAADTTRTVTAVTYKGQKWFAMEQRRDLDTKISDKIFTITYYDSSCLVKATRTIGGIAGFNKINPDTVDLKSIVQLKPQLPVAYLPDTIKSISNMLGALKVERYLFNNDTLYFPSTMKSSAEMAKKGIHTIDQPYYNASGTRVLLFKRATSGTFMRSQRWEPSINPASLKRIYPDIFVRQVVDQKQEL